jgi:hypothetical protein
MHARSRFLALAFAAAPAFAAVPDVVFQNGFDDGARCARKRRRWTCAS